MALEIILQVSLVTLYNLFVCYRNDLSWICQSLMMLKFSIILCDFVTIKVRVDGNKD